VPVRYSCQILVKLEFSRQNFEKYPSSNFMNIRPVGADRRTDRLRENDEVDSRFSQFSESVYILNDS
jgi:hypothetical protein